MDTPLSDPGFDNFLPESQTEAEFEPPPHNLIIDVLGTSFSISAGEEPAYLNEILAQYKVAVANTQGISDMQDPLKVAILTGFLLCDEINKLKSHIEDELSAAETRMAGEAKEVNSITQKLIEHIDRVFEES